MQASTRSGGVESSLWGLAKQNLLNPRRSRPLESLMSWGHDAEDILSALEVVADFPSAVKEYEREVEELLDHGFQEANQAPDENVDIDDMILQPQIALYNTLDVLQDDSLFPEGFLHANHGSCPATSSSCIQRGPLATEEMLFEEASLLFTQSSEEEDQAEDDDEMLL